MSQGNTDIGGVSLSLGMQGTNPLGVPGAGAVGTSASVSALSSLTSGINAAPPGAASLLSSAPVPGTSLTQQPQLGPATSTVVGGPQQGVDELLPLVVQLTNPEQREGVLLELSKKRESFPDLAPILWHTYGTVSALLQEIVSIYPLLSPPTLTAHASNRVCNALALLQCVASHQETRSLFLSAHVPLYLYPFLNTQSKSRPFEYLRLTSLGVIGALVKMDDADVINFLLQTEIIPLCLRIMETGSELSKTVATFIVQKILLDEVGLSYVCATAERFYAVSTVLNNMVALLALNPSVRLLKHIVRCYLRLSDNQRAREALRQCLPQSLRDETFGNALRDDVTVKKWLGQLLSVVGSAAPAGAGNGAGVAGPVPASDGSVGVSGGSSVVSTGSGGGNLQQ
mmetsp:Transcript_1686/g.2310  ORF Transcript_1686/g.2310 Transcript_1686/m.2310 type:complete len:399 (-) Transcript_1686:226-1422(-)